MNDTLYIASGERMEGPYDLLSLTRKIKNGQLTRSSLVVQESSGTPFPADQDPVLREILDEVEHLRNAPVPEIDSGISLFGALRSGWDVFQLNPMTALTTGIFGVIGLIGVLIFSSVSTGVVQGVFCAFWCYLTFNIYLITLSRKSRMQILHGDFYRWLLKKWKALLPATLIGCALPGFLPAILYPFLSDIAVILVFIPGALWTAYFLYLPLIITDRGVGVREALSINTAKMRQAGVDYYSIVLGLVATNIILPILPITMPLTLGAACDIYDRVYNEY